MQRTTLLQIYKYIYTYVVLKKIVSLLPIRIKSNSTTTLLSVFLFMLLVFFGLQTSDFHYRFMRSEFEAYNNNAVIRQDTLNRNCSILLYPNSNFTNQTKDELIEYRISVYITYIQNAIICNRFTLLLPNEKSRNFLKRYLLEIFFLMNASEFPYTIYL